MEFHHLGSMPQFENQAKYSIMVGNIYKCVIICNNFRINRLIIDCQNKYIIRESLAQQNHN